MSVLLSISTVLFVILCVLLIIIILLQSDKSAGMGVLGGSSQSAFGSSTADVITKITSVMVAIFLLGSLGLAVFESQITSSLDKKIMQVEEGKEGVVTDSSEAPSTAPESDASNK